MKREPVKIRVVAVIELRPGAVSRGASNLYQLIEERLLREKLELQKTQLKAT